MTDQPSWVDVLKALEETLTAPHGPYPQGPSAPPGGGGGGGGGTGTGGAQRTPLQKVMGRMLPAHVATMVPNAPSPVPAVQATNYPIIDGDEDLALAIKCWNRGEDGRTHMILAALFTADMIEPYVKWEGGIGWRPTKGNERTLKK